MPLAAMNRAIWLNKDLSLDLRDIPEAYTPGKDEVLVQIAYSGVNPADIAHGTLGFHDCVAGYDFSGTVIEAGEAMKSQFSPGDKVMGLGAPELNKAQQYGAHQDYHVARGCVYKVPENLPMPDAGCMAVTTHTAADGVFNQLEIPLEAGAGAENIPILIWGGSSSVGSAAIQLAVKAGCYPILTTASPRNHEGLRALGATECFDYKDQEIVEKIRVAAARYSNVPLKHALDSVVSRASPSSTVMCELCCADGCADTKFTSTLPPGESKHRDKWQNMFAVRYVDVDLVIPNGPKITYKANSLWTSTVCQATQWCVDNYGKGFHVPNVKVVKGGEAGIDAMKRVRDGKASFEKFVLEHPL